MAAILSRPPCVNSLHSKGITTVVLVTEQVTMHFAKGVLLIMFIYYEYTMLLFIICLCCNCYIYGRLIHMFLSYTDIVMTGLLCRGKQPLANER